MYPFIKKIKDLQGNHSDILPSSGEWSFLREWETPIIEERLEVLSKSGKRDAKVGCCGFLAFASCFVGNSVLVICLRFNNELDMGGQARKQAQWRTNTEWEYRRPTDLFISNPNGQS